MTAADMISLCVYFIVALAMAAIGISQWKSKTPTGFYSGEKPFEEYEITDVSMWNRKHGAMWILYGAVIMISWAVGKLIGTESVWSAAPMTGGLIAPVIIMILYHHRLIGSYKLEIRHATEKDFRRIMEIYAYARHFMEEHGNPNQWGPTCWPPEALIRCDIEAGKSYVCTCGGRVAGTFFFDQGKDIEPSYRKIEDGAWLDESPYGVIHRLAGDGSVGGIGRFCIHWAFEKCGHLRVDTHGDNQVMQNQLKKNGFVYCGIIHVEEDAYPRLAYEKTG